MALKQLQCRGARVPAGMLGMGPQCIIQSFIKLFDPAEGPRIRNGSHKHAARLPPRVSSIQKKTSVRKMLHEFSRNDYIEFPQFCRWNILCIPFGYFESMGIHL